MSTVLIVIGGLPGTGKTSIARGLAAALDAVHVRIDAIEQALREGAPLGDDLGGAGYAVAYAVAADNLRLGRTVVADCVNPIAGTRAAWREVAQREGVDIVEVEVVCSNGAQHRRRVETRTSDIPGLRLPTWREVEERDYEPWDRAHIIVDSAGRRVDQSVGELHALLLARERTAR